MSLTTLSRYLKVIIRRMILVLRNERRDGLGRGKASERRGMVGARYHSENFGVPDLCRKIRHSGSYRLELH